MFEFCVMMTENLLIFVMQDRSTFLTAGSAPNAAGDVTRHQFIH
jgi:hypothetical protein